MDFSFRKADADDVSFIRAVELECFRDPWTEAVIREALAAENGFYYIICGAEGEPIGCGGFSKVLDEAHICNVAITEKHRQRGAGRALMQKMIDEARLLEIEFMTLEVRTGNKAAIALYTSLGFRSFGTRPHFYSDGEDALILWLKL